MVNLHSIFCKVSANSSRPFVLLEPHSSFQPQYRLFTMATFFKIAAYINGNGFHMELAKILCLILIAEFIEYNSWIEVSSVDNSRDFRFCFQMFYSLILCLLQLDYLLQRLGIFFSFIIGIHII